MPSPGDKKPAPSTGVLEVSPPSSLGAIYASVFCTIPLSRAAQFNVPPPSSRILSIPCFQMCIRDSNSSHNSHFLNNSRKHCRPPHSLSENLPPGGLSCCFSGQCRHPGTKNRRPPPGFWKSRLQAVWERYMLLSSVQSRSQEPPSLMCLRPPAGYCQFPVFRCV